LNTVYSGFDLLMVNVLNCLNLVSNNAGIMACPFMLSKDNIELQFATNHLGE
jgi:NAD(P)-dependent dehydrogenase (short-subunit alcohol dehydrogenase family)